ncbi:MAG: hypothetical protein KJN90_12335 [Gammaproteobacteria bacterium]|nr:hypothetical protein [Gammaproteobacteria bacterium]
MTFAKVRKLKFIDKVILHCHDQSLYLVSVLLGDQEHYVTDSEGNFLKSFNKLELQARFSGLPVGVILLRHQSPYDEMIGLPEDSVDNTLEVRIGGLEYAAQPKNNKLLH